MLTRYIQAAMDSASYKVMEDGTYFGEITGLPGIWANEATVEECRMVLQEVLEDWLLLKLRDNDPIPQNWQRESHHESRLMSRQTRDAS